jgi:CheY-like chemotaxis protein
MLQQFGYHVLAAEGPQVALDIARDHPGPIHLVFTDVIMPGMNGREMAEAMEAFRPGVPVVYASGYTDDVALLKQLRASMLFFLQKPFTSQSLSQTVRAALDAHVTPA